MKRSASSTTIVAAAVILTLAGLALAQQPSGAAPASMPASAAPSPAVLLGLLGAAVAWAVRLVIQVRPSGLYVRYVPMHLRPKRLRLESVTRVGAVTYRPMLQYGGWGIRWTGKGKAYNARGKRGVRLDYADGKHLLLGSQRPEELAEAIRQIWIRERGGQ